MDGDLSLSQSLGGLRIANPDEDDVTSPGIESRPPRPTSASSNSTVTDSSGKPGFLPVLSHKPSGDGLDFDPDSYVMQSPSYSSPASAQGYMAPDAARLHHRQSMQHMPAPSSSPYSPYAASNAPLQTRQISQQSLSSRPHSNMYMQPNPSSSSQGSYRYRDDMGSPNGSGAAIARSGSQRMPGRDGSRLYRPGAQNLNGAGGVNPPRRNSKRSRPPGPESTSSTGAASGPQSAQDWRERGASVTSHHSVDANGQPTTRTVKKGVKDFNFGRTLGEGSYSTVLAATDRQNLKEYAIKVLDKRHIIKEKKVKYVNIERDTLNRLTEHPGVVRLYYTFQDERSLYFVLDLASGGELLGVLKKLGSFDVECTKFYGAEILDSIAYMHSRGVIHRDLKPENVLLDRDMHVKITDFGTAKILPEPKSTGASGETSGNPTDGADLDRANSFVGTAEYVSPELLRDKNACKSSDLWAFGCIIYQLLAGRPPFKAANEYLTFQKILALDYSFPDGFPEIARDLVERLLVLEPANRLPVEHIKNHRFFEGAQWGKSLWRQKAPRLKSYVPPPGEPIRLNGGGGNRSNGPALPAAAAAAAAMNPSLPGQQGISPLTTNRPQLRGVTDLPPPSQLDIDWSPVLTDNNERILKLGNLIVLSGPHPASPAGKNGELGASSDKPKFSRFFSGNMSKKRERLVLITSSARIIIAAAGGNEKKAKMELNCLGVDAAWKSFVDSKGLTAWSLNTVSSSCGAQTKLAGNVLTRFMQKEKHLIFEDPRATTSDPAGSKYSTQEWIDTLEQARELALSIRSIASSYSGSITSPTDSISGESVTLQGANERHALRQTLRRAGEDEYSNSAFKGRKRFSKRHSKSGLAAVF
nr:serine/threonine-protein kinase ksg1 [Quercus suber]